jgi:hypothetical protein
LNIKKWKKQNKTSIATHQNVPFKFEKKEIEHFFIKWFYFNVASRRQSIGKQA